MQHDPIAVIRRSRQPIRTALLLGVMAVLRRPWILAILVVVFLLRAVFG